MLREVYNLNSGASFYFSDGTPYETMTKMIYYLNTTDGRNANNIVINKTESNTFLYFIYKGETYATKLS